MSEKVENLLNLSLEVSQDTRERSLALDTGFDEAEQTWEIIVRFFGDEEAIRAQFPGRSMTFLQEGYLITELTGKELERLASLPQVIYIEMPKSLYYQVDNGKRVSCVNSLQRPAGGAGVPGAGAIGTQPAGETAAGAEDLTGQGVLVAILDSGIDYSHPDFRNENGSTRIAWLWDQTLAPREERGERPPEGFHNGVEYSEAVINEALAAPGETERYEICPSRDLSGHGTHVAGIAAGNGRASGGQYRGVSYGSQLLIVKLGNAKEQGFPRTTQLMTGITYCLRKAAQMGLPVVMNISIGNNYGSHAGDSLLETYIDQVGSQWKCNIVIGMGNEGDANTHTAGDFRSTGEVELAVGAYETGLNVQLWKRYVDQVEIELVVSGGRILGRVAKPGTYVFSWEDTDIYVYFGIPRPYSIYQEIYFDFIPRRGYVEGGIFLFRFFPRRIVSGIFDLWLPAGGILNRQTGFTYPVPETTLTIPATASRAISVGAYDSRTREYAPFSGRGFTWETDQIKPDLVAPGVDVISCEPRGDYGARSGTSMAAPFVTGSAALLMEWGIARGNDPYLYGEKMKAAMISGARNLPGAGGAGGTPRPSEKIGWGALCTSDSILP